MAQNKCYELPGVKRLIDDHKDGNLLRYGIYLRRNNPAPSVDPIFCATSRCTYVIEDKVFVVDILTHPISYCLHYKLEG